MATLPQFLKLKPPTFLGSNEKECPKKFLEGIQRACRALKCSGEQSFKFASYQLQDMANAWFETWLKGREVGIPPTNWEEFREVFLECFLPLSVREARAREFELLR